MSDRNLISQQTSTPLKPAILYFAIIGHVLFLNNWVRTSSKNRKSYGHSRSLKWYHSTGRILLPIRLPKQLYAYLIPFRRYSLTNIGVDLVNRKLVAGATSIEGSKQNNSRSFTLRSKFYHSCKFRSTITLTKFTGMIETTTTV